MFGAIAFATVLLVAAVVSQLASAHPDGLEHVAQVLGFHDTATASITSESPLADYSVAGISSPEIAQALAGVIGSIATFAVVSLCLGRRRRPAQPS